MQRRGGNEYSPELLKGQEYSHSLTKLQSSALSNYNYLWPDSFIFAYHTHMMVHVKFIFIFHAFSTLVLITHAASVEKIRLLKRADKDEQSLSQPQTVKKAKRPYHKYSVSLLYYTN